MCTSCDALTINGVYCHELGCPDAWKDYDVECKWCGGTFKPEYSGQLFCSDYCEAAYNGYDLNELDFDNRD